MSDKPFSNDELYDLNVETLENDIRSLQSVLRRFNEGKVTPDAALQRAEMYRNLLKNHKERIDTIIKLNPEQTRNIQLVYGRYLTAIETLEGAAREKQNGSSRRKSRRGGRKSTRKNGKKVTKTRKH